jgi:hypothetical protein
MTVKGTEPHFFFEYRNDESYEITHVAVYIHIHDIPKMLKRIGINGTDPSGRVSNCQMENIFLSLSGN